MLVFPVLKMQEFSDLCWGGIFLFKGNTINFSAAIITLMSHFLPPLDALHIGFFYLMIRA